MKKCALFIFVAFMSIMIQNDVFAENLEYVNSNNIVMSEKEVLNLKKLGFTDDEIDLMDKETFDEHSNLIGEVVASHNMYMKTVNYYNDENDIVPIKSITTEVSKTEYESELSIVPYGICGSVSTEYKLLTSDIIKVGNQYRYKATLTWKKMPKVRSYDIIGIGIDNTVSVDSTNQYFNNSVKYSDGTTASNKNPYSREVNASGSALSFKLYSNTASKSVSSMVISMYFNVNKLSSNTLITLNAYADYAHRKDSSDTSSVSFSISYAGISFGISSDASKYDSMNTAHAIADDINW